MYVYPSHASIDGPAISTLGRYITQEPRTCGVEFGVIGTRGTFSLSTF